MSSAATLPNRPVLRLVRSRKASLTLLGGFNLVLNDSGPQPQVSAGRHQALIAYLALRPALSETRERLAALLWGDSPDSQARQNLRQCLLRIRRDFGDSGFDPLIITQQEIRLDAEKIQIDARDFQDFAKSASPSDQDRAVELYKGALLSGVSAGQASFDEWLDSERARLERAAANSMLKAAERRDAAGDGAGAIRAAEALAALDSFNESAQRLLIRLIARHQSRAAALAHAKSAEQVFKRELDCGFEPETEELIASIRRSPEQTVPLKASAALPAFDGPSLAVLPFRSLAAGQELEFVSIGITEDITAALSRLRWLKVIAHSAAQLYGERASGTALAARELGVRYLLEGSVRAGAGRLRVTAQLSDAESGARLWAEKFDRGLEDVFAVQDEIASSVAAAIEPQLYAAEGLRAAAAPPENLDCWGLTVSAIALIHRFAHEPNSKAQAMLSRAIDIDPGYARAHAALSWALYWAQDSWGTHQDAERAKVMEQVKQHASCALALDPSEPWARLTFGFYLSTSGEHDLALQELAAALEINPNFALARMLYGWALLRAGKFEAGVAETAAALRLSPLDNFSSMYKGVHGLALFGAGRFNEALPFLRAAAAPLNGYLGHCSTLIVCCGQLGLLDEAKRMLAYRREKLGWNWSVQGSAARLSKFAHAPLFIEGMRKAGVPETREG